MDEPAHRHRIELDLTVSRFGRTGMLLAKSEQMPNLMVTGTDEADLWSCLTPVITSLLEAGGERVTTLTLDRSGTPDHIRASIGVVPAA